MRRSSLNYGTPTFGALAGLITSLPVMALLFLGQQVAGMAFVPFDLFDLIARVLPGDVITLGIDVIVDLITALGLGATDTAAKAVEQMTALLIFAGAGALFGLIIAWLARSRSRDGSTVGAIAGLVVLLLVISIEYALDSSGLSPAGIAWLALVFVGWGALLGRLLAPDMTEQPAERLQIERRQMLLKLLGGSAGIAVTAWGLGRFLDVPDEEIGAGRPLAVATATATPQPSTPTVAPEIKAGVTLTLGTTSRRGVSGVIQPRAAARLAGEHVLGGGSVAFVFGNEKTGLAQEDLQGTQERVRIPMAADQPSINLAQAVQVIAYEMLLAALEARGG